MPLPIQPMFRIIFSLISVCFFKQAAAQYQVTIHLQQIQSAAGYIKIAVFNQPVGFPNEQSKAYKLLTIPAQKGNVKLSLGKLPPGKYALAVFHDENDDGHLNTNMIGIPTEGYAFSKKPEGSFGVPSFSSVAITIERKQEIDLLLSY